MVRFLVMYNAPNDVESFERHYRDVHIPLARKLAGLKRYTLSRNVSPIRGGPPCYLVAELDWDGIDAMKAAFRSPEGRETAKDVDFLETLSPGVRSMTFELEEV
jgi:uncharacterized protein (TIGR02118 family)